MIKLWEHQKKALATLRNGSILVGDTGSGKSYVALAYFYNKVVGGSLDPPSSPIKVKDLYIITTVRKRDELSWNRDATSFGISRVRDDSIKGIELSVDSWNNIKKYVHVKDAFFIFDEQRSIGKGLWSKSFIKIAKKNQWIMLSATPGDTWIDLIPVFIAHGFYRNRTEFLRQHVIYAPYVKFPKVIGYLGEEKLRYLRQSIFVEMPVKKPARVNVIGVPVDYDIDIVKEVMKSEWNPFTNKPIANKSEHTHVIRRIINSNPSRIEKLLLLHSSAKKMIIFYNFDYELEILRKGFGKLVSEYNGHKHEPIPTGQSWVYLVQYMSGDAWECFDTNYVGYYSLNYSYRLMVQSAGRINRITTEFSDLFYYRLISDSFLDKGILRALSKKRNFNERSVYKFFPRK